MKVLIVDDDQAVIKAYCSQLKSSGCLVDSAKNGKTAIQLTKETTYSLVIMDYSLPDFNGLDVAAAIGQYSDVPIILVTAFPSMEIQTQSINTNIDDVFSKPLSKVQLNEILAKYRQHN